MDESSPSPSVHDGNWYVALLTPDFRTRPPTLPWHLGVSLHLLQQSLTVFDLASAGAVQAFVAGPSWSRWHRRAVRRLSPAKDARNTSRL